MIGNILRELELKIQPFQLTDNCARNHYGNAALIRGERGVAVGKIHVAVRAQPRSYWLI